MIKNRSSGVTSAFQLLLDEIEKEIEYLKKAGAKALEENNYDHVQNELDKIKKIQNFKEKLISLCEEWNDLTENIEPDNYEFPVSENVHRSHSLVEQTPQEDFFVPLLQTLVEFGGAGEIDDIYNEIFIKIKKVIKEIDFENIPPKVMEAHYYLVYKGLITENEKNGTWRINNNGRQYL